MRDDVTFDRPVKGRLWLHLENGEKWEARPEDLERFDLTNRLDAYMRVYRMLVKCGLESEGRHSSLRYVIEREVAYADLPISFEEGDEDADVVANVRAGLAAWPEEEE